MCVRDLLSEKCFPDNGLRFHMLSNIAGLDKGLQKYQSVQQIFAEHLQSARPYISLGTYK